MSDRQVEYPSMRREVMRALASLADLDYQHRVWRDGQRDGLDFYDDFKANIDCLYDDCGVLPTPEDRLASVLLPGDELVQLRKLGAILDSVIGRVAPNVLPIGDPSWPDVIQASGLALAAMVRAGGYSDG